MRCATIEGPRVLQRSAGTEASTGVRSDRADGDVGMGWDMMVLCLFIYAAAASDTLRRVQREDDGI